MKKHWNQLLMDAAPLFDFLNRDSFFDKQYSGDAINTLVLTDARAAFKYVVDDSFDEQDEWESVSEAPAIFPSDFEWSSWVTHNLSANDFFGLESKNFSGADESPRLS